MLLGERIDLANVVPCPFMVLIISSANAVLPVRRNAPTIRPAQPNGLRQGACEYARLITDGRQDDLCLNGGALEEGFWNLDYGCVGRVDAQATLLAQVVCLWGLLHFQIVK